MEGLTMFKKLLRRWGWMKPEKPKVPRVGWHFLELVGAADFPYELWNYNSPPNDFISTVFAVHYYRKWKGE